MSDLEIKYLAEIIVNDEINSRVRSEEIQYEDNTEKQFKNVYLHK